MNLYKSKILLAITDTDKKIKNKGYDRQTNI